MNTSLGFTACILILLLAAQLTAAYSYTEYVSPVNGVIDYEIDKPDLSVKRLNAKIPGQVGLLTVQIKSIEPKDEWVYDYFHIDVVGIQGNPEDVVIDTGISKERIEDENISLQTISLNIYHDGAWERLGTVRFSEDDDYIYYRSTAPALGADFAVTGESIPVNITIERPCNNNYVCEAVRGENDDNCNDCAPVETDESICVPSDVYCLGNYLVECNEVGSNYTLTECAECSDGICTSSDVFTGMVTGATPIFILLAAVIASVVTYLALHVQKTKEEIRKVEKINRMDKLRSLKKKMF